MYPLGAWEYHSSMALIMNTAKKDLRIFLNVAENDNGASDAEATHHNWVMANQRTAAALKAKGYHYRYVFARGVGHCDSRVRSRRWPMRSSGSGAAISRRHEERARTAAPIATRTNTTGGASPPRQASPLRARGVKARLGDRSRERTGVHRV